MIHKALFHHHNDNVTTGFDHFSKVFLEYTSRMVSPRTHPTQRNWKANNIIISIMHYLCQTYV